MNELVFRKMMADDVPLVAALEQASFSLPWSAQAFQDEIENHLAYYLLAMLDGAVIAYIGAWIIFDEAHITNVAVSPACRKQGVGERLMRQMVSVAKEQGVTSLTLEVRPSNAAALALYHKLGFVEAGVRKNYYEDTHEDALILWLRGL